MKLYDQKCGRVFEGEGRAVCSGGVNVEHKSIFPKKFHISRQRKDETLQSHSGETIQIDQGPPIHPMSIVPDTLVGCIAGHAGHFSCINFGSRHEVLCLDDMSHKDIETNDGIVTVAPVCLVKIKDLEEIRHFGQSSNCMLLIDMMKP